jgi:dTDP-4-dehydrorhamnose 3,5-epimerase
MPFRLEASLFNDEVKIIQPTAFYDDRGFYLPSYRKDEFAELGLPTHFVQDNHSRSKRDVIRGLHFQLDPPMGKIMRVTRGAAMLLAVDIRPESLTFLQYIKTYATEENMFQVWAPAGFARGFRSYEDNTEVQYKCTALYNAASDSAVRWDDPQIKINWGVSHPILSDRDRNAQTVKEYLDGLQTGSV